MGKKSSGDKVVVRADGWGNILTGLGQYERDKRMHNTVVDSSKTYDELLQVYEEDDILQRIVDLFPDEATREWCAFKTGDDPELAQALTTKTEELGTREAFNQARKWARLFGGGGVLMGADDGQDTVMPLDLKRVRTINFLTVLTCRELQVNRWYSDPLAPKYGQPKLYRLVPDTIDIDGLSTTERKRVLSAYPQVHESRILAFQGKELPRGRMRAMMHPGWGMPVIQPIIQLVSDYHMSWSGVFHLLTDMWQAVFKVKGLAQLVAQDKKKELTNRLAAIDMARSLVKAVMIDSEESFERSSGTVAGIEGILIQAAIRISAAARTPVTMLFGNAASGLQANTGGSDHRWFYNQVRAYQVNEQQPLLEKLMRVVLASKDGPSNGKEPEDWGVEWNPLWSMSDLEKAELRSKVSQADKSDVDAGILMPEEVALSRYTDGGYSLETRLIDATARERILQDVTEPASKGEGDAADSRNPEVVDPQTALNGAQVASLLQILLAIGDGTIPRSTGVATITASFPLSTDEAEKLVGELGNGFEPKKLEAPAPEVKPPEPASPAKPLEPLKTEPLKDAENDEALDERGEPVPLGTKKE